MRYTRATDLLLPAVVVGVVVNLLLQSSYDTLPRLPRLAGLTLALLAVVELVLAVVLRPRLQHKPDTRPVHPTTAVRVVALAKASSLLGAIMVGAWAGELGYVAPRSATVLAAGNDTVSGIVGIISAAALIAAALWLEYSCRTPDPPDESETDSGR